MEMEMEMERTTKTANCSSWARRRRVKSLGTARKSKAQKGSVCFTQRLQTARVKEVVFDAMVRKLEKLHLVIEFVRTERCFPKQTHL